VTYRVSVLELYVLLEGEVIPNTPRGPSKDAPVVGDEEGRGEVGVGVGVVMGDGDNVGIGEAVAKEEFPP
jgi:hypothetical protein